MKTRPNPYVGPRSLETGDILYGRERELRQIQSLLTAERTVLLHSPSGAGKTSLIRAGLIPQLSADFLALPPVRVNLEPGDPQPANRYLWSTLLSLEENLPADQRRDPAALATLDLDSYLRTRPRPDGAPDVDLLIFDQFEEILTSAPTDQDGKHAFFAGLGAALKERNRWALFAIREDYLGALAPYLRPLPGRLKTTYRLDLLKNDAAREAIQSPPREQGVTFNATAAEKLVRDLSRVQTQDVKGATREEQGEYVEPVQLQVVCFNLWQNLSEDTTEIDEDDLAEVGSVDESLAGYYAGIVENVSSATDASERDLRSWFDNKLLTGPSHQPVRGQVRKGEHNTEGLVNAALDGLVDAHIVRAEPRAGAIWYELAHDRLIGPVRRNNRAWFEANLKFFQRQALLWDAQGRGEGLLLRGKELEQAESEAKDLSLTPTENAFLEACRALRKREQREHRNNRIRTILVIVATIAMIAAVIFGINASLATQEAKKQASAAQTSEANAVSAKRTAEIAKINADFSKATAIASGEEAKQQAQISRGGELAALALTEKDKHFDLALLFGLEGFHKRNNARTEGTLLTLSDTHSGLVRYLHTNINAAVNTIALSPDGKTLASGSGDKTIILWDISNPNLPVKHVVASGHDAGVESMAFSPDGKTLASGSDDKTIILWNVSNPNLPLKRATISGHTNFVNNVVFSPDGKTLASGSGDKSIILWDVSNPNLPIKRATLSGYMNIINSLVFSPDGKTLASGSEDKTIILWNVSNPGVPAKRATLSGLTDTVRGVAFSPDGKTLASGGSDKTIILWDVSNLNTPIKRATLFGHTDIINSLAFSPDGKTLASGGSDKTIMLWDISNPDSPVKRAALSGHSAAVWSIAFGPDSKTLISCSRDGNIILWDASSLIAPAQRVVLSAHTGAVNNVAFSPDGKTLASGSDDKTVVLWNVSNPDSPVNLAVLSGHTGFINNVTFSPNGKTLASGSSDKTIILWDVSNPATSVQRAILSGHTGTVWSILFSPDGKTLASGSSDKTIILWDISNPGAPAQRARLSGHGAAVWGIALSPDGKTLASGSCGKLNKDNACTQGEIILWDVSNPNAPAQRAILSKHTDWVNSVAFSPDGKTLASGSWDKTIMLWDVSDLNAPIKRATLFGHTDAITSVAFSPNGERLASGSWDKTVTLWDIGNASAPAQLAILSGHTDWVWSVAFSPDGKTLASGSTDTTSILWNLDPQSWVQKVCQQVGRNFSRLEWQQYFPNDAYRKTCEQWPLEPQATAAP